MNRHPFPHLLAALLLGACTDKDTTTPIDTAEPVETFEALHSMATESPCSG